MQPILLYGHPLGSSMGLVAAFEWLGQPYKLSRVDMLGEMRRPQYARLNPRHETPVLLTEDGSVITETMAILRWIEQRDTERRISFSPDSREAVRLQQYAATLNTGFTAAFTPIGWRWSWRNRSPRTRTPCGGWGGRWSTTATASWRR